MIGKILFIHKDTITASFGAEISATVDTEDFTYLDVPIQRLTTSDIAIPYNIPMMEAILPSESRIMTKIEELLAY